MTNTASTKALVRSAYKSDGKGGIVLRCWVEGRLWPIDSVKTQPALWDHCVGCPDCSWGTRGSVELCEAAKRITLAR